MPEIRLEGATKFYKGEKKRQKQMAVEDIDLTIEQGEFVFLIGSSGAGKSTILKLIGGEIAPDAGAVYLDDVSLNRYFGPFQIRLRRTFGHVWQESQLMRKRTIYENLALAARAGGMRTRIDRAVMKVLGLVGMPGVEHCYPVELSIGEVRRVELARALINSPPILVLDEITANLDDDNIWDMFQLLQEVNRKGTTVIMATHASRYVNIMRRRVVTLVDGKIFGDVEKGRYGDVM